MKTILTSILILLSSSLIAQDLQAFDATLNINVGMRSKQNSNVSVQAGINGRRIPVSLLVGASYFEFQDYKNDLSKVGLNATVMLRLANIEFRSMDLNAYSTAYKFDNYFFEYGFKLGGLINNRTRIYLSAGEVKGDNYKSFIVGAHFSLFFFNGYSAY